MTEYNPLSVIMQADQISTQMAKVSVIKFSIFFSILCDNAFWFFFLDFLLLSFVSFMSGFVVYGWKNIAA